jgi:eukaryotic-like serine/threonine-protein kinase
LVVPRTRFRFGQTLGTGGFGVVREAERLADDGLAVAEDRLAVKILAEHHLEDREAVARFRREVRLLERELNHLNIIEVVATDLEASPPYFIMPLAESNLDKELRQGHAGDEAWIVPVFTAVLEGMAHAHERDIPVVHRDLKPLNVLFVQGVPKITDFGLGKPVDPEGTKLTRTDIGLGTQPYMAPEQFHQAREVGPAADVYALGKVLWEMLTGQEPEVLHVAPEVVPARYRYFIEKCCRRQPGERFASAQEALAVFTNQLVNPRSIDPPIEGAEKLVAEWEKASGGERLEVVRRLDEHLQRNGSEFELFFQVVPQLPAELVDLYLSELPAAFASMLRTYDRHVSGSLPFTYCDLLARFYRRVFERTDDLELQRLSMTRLLEVGASHNRWYVGEQVAELLAELREPSTTLLAADVIEQHPDAARWFWDPWVRGKSLPAPVRDAFDRIGVESR